METQDMHMHVRGSHSLRMCVYVHNKHDRLHARTHLETADSCGGHNRVATEITWVHVTITFIYFHFFHAHIKIENEGVEHINYVGLDAIVKGTSDGLFAI